MSFRRSRGSEIFEAKISADPGPKLRGRYISKNRTPRASSAFDGRSSLARDVASPCPPRLAQVLLDPSVQRRMPRKVRAQVFHLVGEHASALEEDVLGIGRREWHGDQLHLRLLGCARCLEVVAAAAGGDDVGPHVTATLAERTDVIA